MHLSSFGMIALDGSVTKPEPGLDFTGYQTALAHYQTTMKLRERLNAKIAEACDRKNDLKRAAG
jgi:hypothetical protein